MAFPPEMAALQAPAAWSEPLAEASRLGGVCLVLGGADSGKSTFCAILANRARPDGPVAVVDADTGQSDLGPPAAVGMGMLSGPISSLEEIPLGGMYFVGLTSPVGHLLPVTVGTALMAEQASQQGARLVIVNTSGLVTGPVAAALKGAKIDLLRPASLVALQRTDELEGLLGPYRSFSRPRIFRLGAAAAVTAKNNAQRRARREQRFQQHLAKGEPVELDWRRIGLQNTPWGGGRPLPGHLRSYLQEELGTAVLDAERISGGVFAITEQPVRGLRRESLGRVEVWPRSRLDRLLVGVLGAAGETLGLGSLVEMDFARRRLTVHTPVPAGRICALRLGAIRVAPDGTELGWI